MLAFITAAAAFVSTNKETGYLKILYFRVCVIPLITVFRCINRLSGFGCTYVQAHL